MEGDLLIAAVAAGSAIAGSAVAQIGPVIQDWLSAKRTRRTLLRERFEELANLTAELTALMMASAAPREISDAKSRAESQQRFLDVAGRVCVLCMVYFQPFESIADGLRRNSILALDAIHDGNDKEAMEASSAFANERHALQDAIRKNAKRYT